MAIAADGRKLSPAAEPRRAKGPADDARLTLLRGSQTTLRIQAFSGP